MKIQEFFTHYKNHPVLFIGTGISLRYLENSYTWDGLLMYISTELYGNHEKYLDIKSDCEVDGDYRFDKIASIIEKDFNQLCVQYRDGKFKHINDLFYKKMKEGIKTSRFKIFICEILEKLNFKEEKKEELQLFKKIRKNIGSIITTNYDLLIENIFEFTPLVGNDILLSNPYGAVYEIHGCVNDATKVIITTEDYEQFNKKYELIRAQLLSLFIHNPIIFMGYGIQDENIKNILKTIFTYVEINTPQADKIRRNFLLVEYENNSNNEEVTEHDIQLEGSTIRINKIKTDNFDSIYKCLSDLTLPISAMDVRKVQNIVHEIYSGGDIQVHFTESWDSMKNSDKIIAIGSKNTITYSYQTVPEMMEKYFSIIEEANSSLISLIDKHSIQRNQFFPIYGFSQINSSLARTEQLKIYQKDNLEKNINKMQDSCKTSHTDISSILNDESLADTYKPNAILWALYHDQISLDEVESYLRNSKNKRETPYRKLLCAYDYLKYKE